MGLGNHADKHFIFCSCHLFDDRLDRFPQTDGRAKYYWFYSTHYYLQDTVGISQNYDEIYFEFSEFDEQSGTFNIDTYVNHELISHQIIVNVEHNLDLSSNPPIDIISYIDQNKNRFDMYYPESDFETRKVFDVDTPGYFYSHGFPFKGYNLRNYFVRYTWAQE